MPLKPINTTNQSDINNRRCYRHQYAYEQREIQESLPDLKQHKFHLCIRCVVVFDVDIPVIVLNDLRCFVKV
eukprot:5865695-Amphidinium_carterae.1